MEETCCCLRFIKEAGRCFEKEKEETEMLVIVSPFLFTEVEMTTLGGDPLPLIHNCNGIHCSSLSPLYF